MVGKESLGHDPRSERFEAPPHRLRPRDTGQQPHRSALESLEWLTRAAIEGDEGAGPAHGPQDGTAASGPIDHGVRVRPRLAVDHEYPIRVTQAR
jgi:hypothetical protein